MSTVRWEPKGQRILVRTPVWTIAESPSGLRVLNKPSFNINWAPPSRNLLEGAHASSIPGHGMHGTATRTV